MPWAQAIKGAQCINTTQHSTYMDANAFKPYVEGNSGRAQEFDRRNLVHSSQWTHAIDQRFSTRNVFYNLNLMAKLIRNDR